MRISSENKVSCGGAYGGNYEFLWRVTKDRFEDKWIFRVETEANVNTGKSFELTVVARNNDPDTVYIVMMHHYDQGEYRAKSIPDAPASRDQTGTGYECGVQSAAGCYDGVYRADAATAVWDRLVRKGLATYAADRDVYVLR